MAIIYTYPLITSVEPNDLFLISDTSNSNATRSVTASVFGEFIATTYGGASNIYTTNGSISGNRELDGANLYSLSLASLTSFTVNTSGDINLKPGGDVVVGEFLSGSDVVFSNEYGIKNSINPTTSRIFWDSPGRLNIKSERDILINAGNVSTTGVQITNGNAGGILSIINGVPLLSGANNDIADITSAKNLITKEWAENYIANWAGSTNITTLGTITTGTWNGTTIAIANGGTGASTAQDGINELTQSGGATANYVLTRDGGGNAVWEASADIYTSNGTVGTNRTVSLTDTLTWSAGSVRRISNSTAIIEVTQESDFGTAVAGVITLPANTTYQVIGSVTCSNRLDISVEGISIIGNNRQLDKLTYTGTGDFITVTDVNFTINDIWLASTNSSSLLIRASNVAASGFNNGRTRVLEIVNCQFRNCYNVMNVDGFDLVDISNTLFFYIQAPSIGLSFRDTSKLEISSCELIRWYDETTNGTANPPGWATCSMIELRANNLASFGAVNVNGCIIHPQQTQNGIDIKAGSSTGFGTISSSAFVNTGLAGGRVFLANALTPALGGYSQTEALTYDVFSNQGIPNSSAYGNFHIGAATGFDTNTGAGGATWLQVAYPSTPAASNEQRFTFTSPTVPRVGGTAQGGLLTYDGTKTIFVTITCTVVYNDTGGGNNAFEFGIAKNKVSPTFTPEVSSVLALLIGGGAYNAATLVYTDTITTGDDFQLVVQNISSGDDIEIISTQFLIKE